MRTRVEYYPIESSECESDHVHDLYTGAATPRTKRVWVPTQYTPVYIPGHWVDEPDPRWFLYTCRSNRVASVEYAWDLSEGNTRDNWNAFEHYRALYGRGPMGSCQAGTKVATAGSSVDEVSLFSPDVIYDAGLQPFGSSDAPFSGLQSLCNAGNGHIVPAPPDLGTLQQNALRAMLPGIRPNLSLVNSVIELKDFRWVKDAISRVIAGNGLLWLVSRFKRYYSKLKTLKQILGGGSSGYLEYKFNVLPLLSDICGIRRSLETVHRQINKFVDNEGRLLTRHFVCELGAPYNTLPARESTNGGGAASLTLKYKDKASEYSPNPVSGQVVGGTTALRQIRWRQATFHAEVQYAYHFSSYERENAYLLGFLDSLGVNINPAIIWNAIPWSFAIDWVIGVNRWLDQFKERNLDPLTIIRRCLWSVEYTRDVELDVRFNSGLIVPSEREARAVTVSETAYRRELFTVTPQDLITSGVSLSEFSLASALYLSRYR